MCCFSLSQWCAATFSSLISVSVDNGKYHGCYISGSGRLKLCCQLPVLRLQSVFLVKEVSRSGILPPPHPPPPFPLFMGSVSHHRKLYIDNQRDFFVSILQRAKLCRVNQGVWKVPMRCQRKNLTTTCCLRGNTPTNPMKRETLEFMSEDTSLAICGSSQDIRCEKQRPVDFRNVVGDVGRNDRVYRRLVFTTPPPPIPPTSADEHGSVATDHLTHVKCVFKLLKISAILGLPAFFSQRGLIRCDPCEESKALR